jgi:GNAT superfamily N-acetyltransferase
MTTLDEATDNALLSRIEDAGLNASAPPQQRWVDGWLVRFSPGKAQRARCINAVAQGRLPLDQKLATCQALYAEAGLPMVLRMTPFSQPESLDRALAERGYARFDDTRVMVCPDIHQLAASELPAGHRVDMVSLEAYAHIVGAFRGTAADGISAHVQRLRSSPVGYRAFVLHDPTGASVACAQMAIEDQMVGLYDIFTAAASRGQGLSRRLCAWVLRQAARQGARVGYLQVDAGNHAARAVYAHLGFGDAYSYHYRSLPAPAG